MSSFSGIFCWKGFDPEVEGANTTANVQSTHSSEDSLSFNE